MRTCDGCRFCCWSFSVNDIPEPIQGFEFKPTLTHCRYECENGCAIYSRNDYPHQCHVFRCPYLDGLEIHKPNIFQKLLEKLGGETARAYIPAIPECIPIEKAEECITTDRSVAAMMLIDLRWMAKVISLQSFADGIWIDRKEQVEFWNQIFTIYGAQWKSN